MARKIAKNLRNPARGINLRGKSYWLSLGPRGARRHVNLGTLDPIEAAARAGRIRMAPVLKGAAGDAIGSLVPRFLSAKLARGEFGKRSFEWYGNHLRRFCRDTGDRPPASYSTADIQRWHDGLPVSHGTAGGMLEAVRSLFSWAVASRMIHVNPCSGVRKRKGEGSGRVLFCTTEMRDRLIAECPREDLRFALFVGFHAGLRYCETVELRPEHFILGTHPGVLHLHRTETFRIKDRESRSIPLTRALREFIDGYGLREPFMLRPDVRHGRCAWRWNPRKPWVEYMAAQGCPWVTPHVLRHTFASLLVQRGRSIYKVASWLGDGVEITRRHYAHLSPEDSDIDV